MTERSLIKTEVTADELAGLLQQRNQDTYLFSKWLIRVLSDGLEVTNTACHETGIPCDTLTTNSPVEITIENKTYFLSSQNGALKVFAATNLDD